MTYSEVDLLHKNICDHIISRNLKNAIDNLSMFFSLLHLGVWSDKVNELETTYKYMLQYAIEGIDDPHQEMIYNQLRVSMLEVADEMKESLLLKDSSDYTTTQKRLFNNNIAERGTEIILELSSYKANVNLAGLLENSLNVNGKSEEFSINHEEIINSVFNYFWLADKYKDTELNLLRLLLNSPEIESRDKSLVQQDI